LSPPLPKKGGFSRAGSQGLRGFFMGDVMQLVRYLADWFHCPAGSSIVKYASGQSYAQNDETLAHVAAGIAELVDTTEAPAAPEMSDPDAP
jgi:hypothetical protein